jgi:hypothetical protein
MRLLASFTVFNGLELLEASIRNILPHVDEVQLCWQGVSNKGEQRACVEVFCRSLAGRKVTLLEFTPDLTVNTKRNEAAKLQMRIDYAKHNGFTHILPMACDHFYTGAQMEWAKADIMANGNDLTHTAMFTYYKRPTWRVDPMEDYYCPFITEVKSSTTVGPVAGYPLRVDPSTQVGPFNKWRLYKPDEVLLHHYSMVRVDVAEKFRNAAASIRWKPEQVAQFITDFERAELGMPVAYFGGRVLVEAEDLFGIGNDTP